MAHSLSLVALKARLVGIEDGELLAGQQLWLVHLRDSPPSGSGRGQPGPRGGAGTYRVGRVLLVLQIGVVQVLATLHAAQRVGLGAGTQTELRGQALGNPAAAGAPVLPPAAGLPWRTLLFWLWPFSSPF